MRIKKNTGYLEGYYGKSLTWSERCELVDHLSQLGLDTYVYAPKEDVYHRLRWKEPYSEAWLREFKRFTGYAQKKKVKVVYSIAPGLSFDYTSEDDYALLIHKCFKVLKKGASGIALLMDDVPLSLPPKNQKSFTSLGAAHNQLIKRFAEELSKKERVSVWYCPTVYADELNKDASYLKDLSQDFPKEVSVFWTGTHVITPTVNQKNMKAILKLFPRVLFWDNYYANDYCPTRFFIGPLMGRTKKTVDGLTGYLLNPTGLLNTDKFYLSLLKGLLIDEEPLRTWKKSCIDLNWPKEVKMLLPLTQSPFTKPKALTEKVKNIYQDALYFLAFEWESSFKQEWFVYLQVLLRDLKVEASGRKAKGSFRRRFSVLLQETLFNKE